MNWEQELINAQVSVNRAMFEMNKPGRLTPEEPDPRYIMKQMEEAIESLNHSLLILKKESEPEWKKKMKKEFMSR